MGKRNRRVRFASENEERTENETVALAEQALATLDRIVRKHLAEDVDWTEKYTLEERRARMSVLMERAQMYTRSLIRQMEKMNHK